MESDNSQSSTSASTAVAAVTTVAAQQQQKTNSYSSNKAPTIPDGSKLTFGPAWLRQLSSGDTNKTQLPPSPGLTFQLSKHRYSREEMLAIFETIESNLKLPSGLDEFEDLYVKSTHKPILLTQPSQEEQKYLSTCVNSQAVLNSYNKVQPSSNGGQSQGGQTSTRGGSSSRGRGDGTSTGRGRSTQGGGGVDKSLSLTNGNGTNERGERGGERGGSGRGRGRGRGTLNSDERHNYISSSQQKLNNDVSSTVDTQQSNKILGNSTNTERRATGISTSGDRPNNNNNNNVNTRNNGTKFSTSTRTHEQQAPQYEDAVIENKYARSRASNEDNWRKSESNVERDESDGDNSKKSVSPPVDKNKENDNKRENKSTDWRQSTNKQQPKYSDSQPTTKSNAQQSKSLNDKRNVFNNNTLSTSTEKEPEWLDDDGDTDEKDGMTFDEQGQYVPVKKLKDDEENASSESVQHTYEPTKQAEKELTVGQDKSSDTNLKELTTTQMDQPLKDSSHTQQISPLSIAQQLIKPDMDHSINADTLLMQNFLQSQMNLLSTNVPTVPLQIVENHDPKKGAVPITHADAFKWLYLDPQNQIQGVFTSEEMASWFVAGYFSLNLMIRRGCDEQFLPLSVVAKNWGRIPFTPGPQKSPLIKPKQQHTQQQDLLLAQQQQAANLQLMQHLPQLQALSLLSQQQQQQQQQQHVDNNALKMQQEALLNNLLMANNIKQATIQAYIQQQQQQLLLQQQQQQQQQQSKPMPINDLCSDPAILSAVASSQSIWGDMPLSTTTPPMSNKTTQQQQQTTSNNLLQQNMLLAAVAAGNHTSLNENISNKVQAFFEMSKKEEDRRRKQGDDQQQHFQAHLLREEEARRRLEELRIKEEEELVKKRLAEERLREELRREEQRRRLEEIIRKQEGDKNKKMDDEIKRRKDEENRIKLELLKKKDQERRMETERKRIEDIERNQTMSEKQQTELILKKQLEFEKVKQQELKNLQLPAHANWAKQQLQLNSQQNLPLKSIVEQQSIESMEKHRQLMEHQKQQQAELAAQQSQNTWSALVRGNPATVNKSTVNLSDIQLEEKKQQELIRIQQEQQAQMIKLQQQKEAQAKSIIKQSSGGGGNASWAAWSQAQQQQQQSINNPNFPPPQSLAPTNAHSSSSTGFWNDLVPQEPTKKTSEKSVANKQPQTKQQSNTKESKEKSSKAAHAVEPPHNMFKNPTDEFMKWCGEQLRDFNADLHVPTFVQFLYEIESPAEIEDYVCSYLGESPQAKEFARRFHFNRDHQKASNNGGGLTMKMNGSSNLNIDQDQFQESKSKKGKKAKGQPISHLLSFKVQPDPNLTNRGGIDQL